MICCWVILQSRDDCMDAKLSAMHLFFLKLCIVACSSELLGVC